MGSYFISPPEKTEWELSTDEFATALRSAWPTVHIETIPDASNLHRLRWTLEPGTTGLPGEVHGSFARDGQTVHLDGDLRGAAVVARWFRRVVPQEQPLVFYDEGFSSDVLLTPDVTEAEITQPFLSG